MRSDKHRRPGSHFNHRSNPISFTKRGETGLYHFKNNSRCQLPHLSSSIPSMAGSGLPSASFCYPYHQSISFSVIRWSYTMQANTNMLLSQCGIIIRRSIQIRSLSLNRRLSEVILRQRSCRIWCATSRHWVVQITVSQWKLRRSPVSWMTGSLRLLRRLCCSTKFRAGWLSDRWLTLSDRWLTQKEVVAQLLFCSSTQSIRLFPLKCFPPPPPLSPMSRTLPSPIQHRIRLGPRMHDRYSLSSRCSY